MCHQDVCGCGKEKDILLTNGFDVNFAQLNHLSSLGSWQSVRELRGLLLKNACMSVHVRLRDAYQVFHVRLSLFSQIRDAEKIGLSEKNKNSCTCFVLVV